MSIPERACPVCWGSHGCGLPEGHDGIHVCDDCSEFCASGPERAGGRTIPGRVRYLFETGRYSDWSEAEGFRV